MENVLITIDGRPVQAEAGIPLVLAAERAGIYIPHFCYYEGLSVFAGCRLCVVEIEGARGLPLSCTTNVTEGLVVHTKSPAVLEMQHGVMGLMLMDHPDRCLTCHRQEHCGIQGVCLRDAVVTYRCLTCAKNKRCEFQGVSDYLEMHKQPAPYYLDANSWYAKESYLPVHRENPFIELDFNECILCTRCVRVCDEVRGLGVYEMTNRGPAAEISTAFGLPMQETDCDFCGACVDVCPVACILDRTTKWSGPAQEEQVSLCTQCGDGCQIIVQSKNGKLLRAVPDMEGSANHGQGCARGRYNLGFVHDRQRLTMPLVRRDGGLVVATWEEALDFIAARLPQYRGGQFAALASPRSTNEENYLLQKLTRGVMQSNNIDHYPGLDSPESVAPLAESLGIPAMTNSIGDITEAKAIFILNANVTVTHPIVGLKVKEAARYRDAKLVIANPEPIELSRWATLELRQRPGTEVALVGGMMRVIVDEGLLDRAFIQERCEGFEEFRRSLDAFDLAQVAQLTGISQERIREAARLYGAQRPAAILYDGTVGQFGQGAACVRALVDLALLTGNLGVVGGGVNALRSASNQQGAWDTGCLPDSLPGFQPVASSEARGQFEATWGAALPQEPGLAWPQMVEAASVGQVRAMVLVGEDPVLDDPDKVRIRQALEALDFLVVQDIFLTETAQLADVVLPSVSFAEKDGTMTNTERRVQRLRQAVASPGEARPDWQALCQVAQRLGGRGFDYGHPSEIFDEIARLVPFYGGLSYQRLDGEGGLQWPCPSADHPGTPVLHAQGIARGKARFIPVEYALPAEPVSPDYPLLLAASRGLYRYDLEVLAHNGERPKVLLEEQLLRIHPGDAQALELADGQRVRVVSRSAQMETVAQVTEEAPQGVLLFTFPVLEYPTELLTPQGLDLVTKVPEFGVSGVRLEKVVP